MPDLISSRYVTDPCTRWNFMASLDPNYAVDYLKTDGHAIIHLPTLGKHIVERIFEKSGKKHQWAYGHATYILDDDTYNSYKDRIVIDYDKKQNFVIDRKSLVSLRKETKGVEKVVHAGWGKSMCEAFDVDTSSFYTQEKREEIHRLAEEVERSKLLR